MLCAMVRLLQIVCIVITAAILFAFREAFYAAAGITGPGFGWGFAGGIAFAVYGLILWIDPASRPRGSAPHQQGARDGFDRR